LKKFEFRQKKRKTQKMTKKARLISFLLLVFNVTSCVTFLLISILFYENGYSDDYGGFMTLKYINGTIGGYTEISPSCYNPSVNYNENMICTLQNSDKCYSLEYVKNHFPISDKIEINGLKFSKCYTKNYMFDNSRVGFILLNLSVFIPLMTLLFFVTFRKQINEEREEREENTLFTPIVENV
jgi:hypothetical protein